MENPGAPPFEYRVERSLKKAEAGAQFLQLQLCFERDHLERFMTEAVSAGLAAKVSLIPSICIVRTASALRFIDDKVAGISVPAELLARVEAADDQLEACFDVAYDLARHALELPGVAGLHFISFRKDAGIAKLCARLGIPPRDERETRGYRPAIAV